MMIKYQRNIVSFLIQLFLSVLFYNTEQTCRNILIMFEKIIHNKIKFLYKCLMMDIILKKNHLNLQATTSYTCVIVNLCCGMCL